MPGELKEGGCLHLIYHVHNAMWLSYSNLFANFVRRLPRSSYRSGGAFEAGRGGTSAARAGDELRLARAAVPRAARADMVDLLR